MGSLNNFNFKNCKVKTYVETGTGVCTSLAIADKAFKRCYSVDLDPIMVQQARIKFPRAIIEEGLSTVILEAWLKEDLVKFDSICFFLDAHFPGSDFHGEPYSVTAPNAVPLEEELNLIKKYRPNSPDIIICDDARIYTSGPFAGGNTEWLQVPGGYAFIKILFPTASISIEYEDQGYIIIDRRQDTTRLLKDHYGNKTEPFRP